MRRQGLRNSPTLRIISTSVLTFVCYFTIGLQLAVVPGFVHLHLGYHAVVAGLAISAQYVATLSSRPIAGRMGAAYTAQVISWSGIASYGAQAVGAPVGVWLENSLGLGAIGVVSVVVTLAGLVWASAIGNIPILPGNDLAFRQWSLTCRAAENLDATLDQVGINDWFQSSRNQGGDQGKNECSLNTLLKQRLPLY